MARPFHVLIAVWGEAYVETMARTLVPSLLFAGNVPGLSRQNPCTIVFVTRPEDEPRIRDHASVKRLMQAAKTEFIHFDPAAFPNVYLAMSRAHYLAGTVARREGAVGIIASPDALISDGSLMAVARHVEQGKAAVLCAGPRLLQEAALPVIDRRLEGAALSGRDLVSLTLEHLHPQMHRYFVDSGDFSTFPAMCCWSLGSKGFLLRAFHLHPIMVDFARVTNFAALEKQSIDGVFLDTAFGDAGDIAIETDSDSIYMCSVTPADAWYSESRQQTWSIDALRAVAHCEMCADVNRRHFQTAIKIHSGDLDDEWRRLEASTKRIAESAILAPQAASSGLIARLIRFISRA